MFVENVEDLEWMYRNWNVLSIVHWRDLEFVEEYFETFRNNPPMMEDNVTFDYLMKINVQSEKHCSSMKWCHSLSKSLKWRLVKNTRSSNWKCVNASYWISFNDEEIIAEHRLKNGQRFLMKISFSNERNEWKNGHWPKIILHSLKFFSKMFATNSLFIDRITRRISFHFKGISHISSFEKEIPWRTYKVIWSSSKDFKTKWNFSVHVSRVNSTIVRIWLNDWTFIVKMIKHRLLPEEFLCVFNNIYGMLFDHLLKIIQWQWHSSREERRREENDAFHRKDAESFTWTMLEKILIFDILQWFVEFVK